MNRPLEKTAFQSGSQDPFERVGQLPAEAEGASTSWRRSSSGRSPPTTGSAPTRARWLERLAGGRERDGRGDAGAVGQAAGHARGGRAVHGDVQGRRLRGAAARDAAAALPGVRLRAAGVLPARARGGGAADPRRAVPVRRRRGVRVLPGAAAGDQLPAELQRRLLRHPAAGAGLLLVRDHGADRDGGAVPDPRRDPRRHAARGHHPAAAAPGAPLRDRDHRHHRGAAPRARIRSRC